MGTPQKSHTTMFYTAGQTTAVLVTRSDQGMRSQPRRFRSPEAALGWCRLNGVMFVWLPSAAQPEGN